MVDAGQLSGGNWLAALPLANLQNRIIGKVARSQGLDLGSTQLRFNAVDRRAMRTIGLVGHNFSLSAKYRVRISNLADFSTLEHDSGWVDFWPALQTTESLPWAAENWWSGRYTERDRMGYTWTAIYTLPFQLYSQYVSIEIDDVGNGAGFVQFGRLFIGDAWQPRTNMLLGAGLGWQSNTEVQEAISGAEFFAEKRPYRLARFTTGFMGEDEAFGSAFDIKRRVGISGEVIFVFDPEDTIHALRRQFYGRLRELSLIEYPYPRLTSTPWEIKEMV